MTTLTNRLIVTDAEAALRFYEAAFDARVLERFRDEALGRIVHAAFQIGGDLVITLADEHREHGNVAPTSLGASPVLFTLTVDDPDAWGRRFEEAGGRVLIPIEDRFYGHREGRFRDPFGHLWIISKIIEDLSPEEIHRRMQKS